MSVHAATALPVLPPHGGPPLSKGLEVLSDMLGSDADPRDLTQQQIPFLRSVFEDRDVGLFLFAQHIFGYKDLTASLHLPIARLLGRWGESTLDNGSIIYTPPVGDISSHVVDSYRRIIVMVAREMFKTSLCTRANALWTIARDPSHDPTIGIFNEVADNVEKWIAAICEVVEGNRLFQVLWREMIPPGISFWDKEAGRTMPRRWKWGGTGVLFQRNAMGIPELSIEPHGIGGSATGKHFTHKILDDIIGEKAAQSTAVMQDAVNWIDNSRPLERPAEHGNELICCTPWSYNDVYTHAMKRWKGDYKVYRRSILEDEFGEPDALNGTSIFPEKISTAKARKLLEVDSYTNWCLSPDAPILMADWSERPICMLAPGDKIIGFTPAGENGLNRLRIEATEVQYIDNFMAEVVEYTFEDGSTIVSTPEHKWFTGANGKHRKYSPLDVVLPNGNTLKNVIRLREPEREIESLSPDEREAAGYLAAIFDGEGHIRTSRGRGQLIVASQCPHKNPEVCDRIRSVLKTLGFEWSEHMGGRTKGGKTINFTLNTAQQRYKFLKLCRPARNQDLLIKSLMLYWNSRKLNLVSTRPLGRQTVYTIQTGTGTYVAHLCMSSNSQYMCIPKSGRSQDFSAEWLHYGSIVYAGTEPCFKIDPLHYDPDRHDIDVQGPAPQLVPLSWMDKAVLLDPAPSKLSELRADPHCRNGITVVGIDPWRRRFAFDCAALRDTPIVVMNKLMELYLAWATDRIGIEEVNFSAVYAPFMLNIIRRDYKIQPTFIPLEPKGRQKPVRIANNLRPPMEDGFWYFNRAQCAPLVQELLEYPNGMTNDLIDSLAYTDEAVFPSATPNNRTRDHYRERREAANLGVTGYGDFV